MLVWGPLSQGPALTSHQTHTKGPAAPGCHQIIEGDGRGRMWGCLPQRARDAYPLPTPTALCAYSQAALPNRNLHWGWSPIFSLPSTLSLRSIRCTWLTAGSGPRQGSVTVPSCYHPTAPSGDTNAVPLQRLHSEGSHCWLWAQSLSD